MTGKVKLDRRIVKTRKAIHQAFLTLFYSRDMESITINDIADLADVNRGTIYLHYNDKYDLLDKLIEEHIDNMIGFCNPDRGGRIYDELLPLFEYVKEHRAFFTAMFATHKAAVFRKKIMKIIAANMRHKLERDARPPAGASHELRAQFITSAFVGMIEWWVEQGYPHSPDYMAVQLEELIGNNG